MLNKLDYSYNNENSLIHKINPSIKLLGLLFYVLFCLLKYNNYLFICNVTIVFCLILFSNVDAKRYLKILFRWFFILLFLYVLMYSQNMVIRDINVIVFKGLQANSPCRFSRGNVQRTELPLVVERRVVVATSAVNCRHHLSVATIFLFMVAASQLQLAEFHFKTRHHLHPNLRIANDHRVLVTDDHLISSGRERTYCNAVGSIATWRPLVSIKVIVGHAKRHRRLATDGHFGTASDFARFLRLRKKRASQSPKQQ